MILCKVIRNTWASITYYFFLTSCHIWIFLMAMLSIVSFTGCDKTDEPNGPDTDYDNLFDKTYTINNDGCCVLEDCEPTRATVIEDEVKGYGWKVIGMYKVQDNGRLSQTNYLYTGNGVDYWFESDGHLIGFHHGDTYKAINGFCNSVRFIGGFIQVVLCFL
mgnify:CR=1 FL=1